MRGCAMRLSASAGSAICFALHMQGCATVMRGGRLHWSLSILALATWLSAIAFVASSINVSLTPFGLDCQLWTGLLSVAVLFLSIVQLKTDWKGRSDAHRQTLDIYAEVKREAGYFLATGELDEAVGRRMSAPLRYGVGRGRRGTRAFLSGREASAQDEDCG